jgi:hypothetical protein
VVETIASKLIVTGILSQHDDKGILHSVANFSRKPLPMEINYNIYDKELLTIICTLKEWYPLLKGFLHNLEVISNY